MLKVLDKNLNFKTIIHEYTYLRMEPTYSEVGEFEMHTSFSNQNALSIQADDIIFMYENEPFVVTSIKKDTTQKDIPPKLIIKGKELKSITKQRLIVPIARTFYVEEDRKSEWIIKDLIYRNFIDTPDLERNYGALVNSGYQALGTVTSIKKRYVNIQSTIEELAIYSELGWVFKLELANKNIVSDCYVGVDRTAGQSVNNRILFNENYENIKVSYEFSTNNYYNVVTCGSGGEEDQRTFVTVGSASGKERRELFVDASNIRVTPYSQNASQNALDIDKLTEYGKAKLSEFSNNLTYQVDVIKELNQFFRKDYYLGDKVSILTKQFGIKDQIVTKVTEIYENNTKRIFITLGYEQNKLKQVIKNRLKDLETLKSR